ncbi:MAG: MBL fold metallo-hydrolase [Sedimentisphaerales bacterium]|nr:MBL fold metallo-hydrolase [Sedimentisphaerales bacterium]
MRIKLRFLGAARNVTGSRHLLEVNGSRILIDCGLYQERQFKSRNWDPFPVSVKSIDAVLLTHAHLDHCGLLPKLVREGFGGKIYCTAATAEIARIILLDSAKIQEEDAEYKRKRHKREGRKGPYPEIPLYTVEDAQKCFPHLAIVKYGQQIEIAGNVEATFYDAGHVLGSSFIKIKASNNGQQRTILFSGDIGRPDRPIVRDPAVVEDADYILVESTYGDRVHQGPKDTEQTIAKVINDTKQAGGNIVVPSFALERAQELLYYVNELLIKKQIPPLMVFLDSPMASSITKVFQQHPELFDEEMADLVRNHLSPFKFAGLKMVENTEESKAINQIKGTVMIIAGSGMCTGGRIKHHLINNIERPQSSVMFVGYQASGTLGRIIVDGAKEVRIHGQNYKVQAKVIRVNGFSAHADKNELLNWLTKSKKRPRKLFVVHGESDSAVAFGEFVKGKTGWDVAVPQYQDEVILD